MNEEGKNAIRKSWTPERRAQQAEIMCKRMENPKYRESVGRATKARLANPESKEKLRADIRASWTPERRAKMSEMAKARLSKPEVRAKIVASLRKRYSDPEVLSEARTKAQEYWTPEQRRKHSELVRESIKRAGGFTGRKHGPRDYTHLREVMSSPEYKAKMSEAQKRAWAEFRASGKARVLSDEARQRMSDKAKARMAKPEVRANLSAKMRGRKCSDETVARMRKAAKIRAKNPATRLRMHDMMVDRLATKGGYDQNRPKVKSASMKRLLADRGRVEMYLSGRLSMKFGSTREAAVWIMEHTSIMDFFKVEEIIRKECRQETGEQCFGYFWRYV